MVSRPGGAWRGNHEELTRASRRRGGATVLGRCARSTFHGLQATCPEPRPRTRITRMKGPAPAPNAATAEPHQGMNPPHDQDDGRDESFRGRSLEALVQAMNAAQGAEKTDAIAAVVTALVEQRRSMHSSMAGMMNMMGMMNQMSAPAAAAPAQPKP